MKPSEGGVSRRCLNLIFIVKLQSVRIAGNMTLAVGVLHKSSFYRDPIIAIVGTMVGWCYSMGDGERPADVINHQHSFLLCQSGQGAQ